MSMRKFKRRQDRLTMTKRWGFFTDQKGGGHARRSGGKRVVLWNAWGSYAN